MESHLLQMRGLKRIQAVEHHSKMGSHLLQMRGLKLPTDSTNRIITASHLLQMRGLKRWGRYKQRTCKGRIFYRCVDWNLFSQSRTVFEIRRIFYRCVDWNIFVWIGNIIGIVASFTDAWIETRKAIFKLTGLLSRIFYRCVDWNAGHHIGGLFFSSHLLQMRGLKQAFESGKDLNTVASFTDAWIETSEDDRTTTTRCRIFYRCVDWNDIYYKKVYVYRLSHLLQMRGLKHFDCTAQLPISRSHLLQMRGLKPEQVVIINI